MRCLKARRYFTCYKIAWRGKSCFRSLMSMLKKSLRIWSWTTPWAKKSSSPISCSNSSNQTPSTTWDQFNTTTSFATKTSSASDLMAITMISSWKSLIPSSNSQTKITTILRQPWTKYRNKPFHQVFNTSNKLGRHQKMKKNR